MEEIEAELEQKSIERVESVIKEVKEQVEPAKAKPKRVRSQKQIEAFEKAKLKRAENLRLKKEQKEKDKLEKKTKIKEFKKELDSDPPQREQAEQSKPNSVRALSEENNVSKPVIQTPASAPNSREQVIQNHYYYYGVPPPQQEHSISKSKKKKKIKKPPTPPSSSSGSESESSDEEYYHEPKSPPVEPESYKELQSIPKPTPRRQNPKSSLKFGFA